jgi:hypothetical protein
MPIDNEFSALGEKRLRESAQRRRAARSPISMGLTQRPSDTNIIDERPNQARENIEGAMKNYGKEPDPPVGRGRGFMGGPIKENENWQYLDDEDQPNDPPLPPGNTPGRRA